MVKYFRYFPRIKYSGQDLVDITRRVDLVEKFKNDTYAFVPYVVQGNDRPEDIAHLYYGSMDHTWLVYMANGLIDIDNEWPKTEDNFDRFMIKKYAELSGATGTAVIEWTMNEAITENIAFYYRKTDFDDQITNDTYDNKVLIPGFIDTDWTPIRYYDLEVKLNDDRRNIYLVNQLYIDQMNDELRKIMNV